MKDLAENGPTDEEVNMAKLNLQKNIPENRQRNNWWKDGLEMYLLYGSDRDALYEAAVNSLSKELIRNALNEVLSQNNFVELVMKPANTAEAE